MHSNAMDDILYISDEDKIHCKESVNGALNAIKDLWRKQMHPSLYSKIEEKINAYLEIQENLTKDKEPASAGWGAEISEEAWTNYQDEPWGNNKSHIGSTADYTLALTGLDEKTVEEIVSHIPTHATALDLSLTSNKEDRSIKGFKYIWRDIEDIRWEVRVHEPISNCHEKWIMRIMKNNKYMDASGNFYHPNYAEPWGSRADEKIIDDTHIPIVTPNSHILDLLGSNSEVSAPQALLQDTRLEI